MTRLFELRFIREDGRVVRGPILGGDEIHKAESVIANLQDLNNLVFRFGSYRAVVPYDAIKVGHAEIVRIGRIRAWLRAWRYRD